MEIAEFLGLKNKVVIKQLLIGEHFKIAETKRFLPFTVDMKIYLNYSFIIPPMGVF
ncbi:hypothetical protein [Clostridium lacusfryxellense]|uniref:hypothetical protein n=1 Tax=Clostridium lacusfryxellense TaxID=205328 RepID=UPI001C0D320C|nr:hypothetical protein [Clostridium lacusfryxellense]MBU3114605.1 hypothetical protein [Clostridium lacusfryxellense]